MNPPSYRITVRDDKRNQMETDELHRLGLECDNFEWHIIVMLLSNNFRFIRQNVGIAVLKYGPLQITKVPYFSY